MQTSSAGSALLQAALLKTSTQQEQVCAARRAGAHPLRYPAPMDLEEHSGAVWKRNVHTSKRKMLHSSSSHGSNKCNQLSLQSPAKAPTTRLHQACTPPSPSDSENWDPLGALACFHLKALGFSPTSYKRRALHVHTQSGEKKWRVSAWVPSCFILVCSFPSKSALPVLQQQLE